jgi:hypothetical protein
VLAEWKLALLSILFVGALACTNTPAIVEPSSNEPSSSEPSSFGESPRPPHSDPNAITPADGVTVLIDAGATPHAPLRYHPTVGDTARWTMVVFMTSNVTLMGETMRTEFGLEFSVETEVVAVDDAAGEHEYRSIFVNARMLTSMGDRAAVEAALAPYLDLEYWSRTSDRGDALEFRYSRNGAPVDPSTIEGLNDPSGVMLSFPEQPVGIGARWLEYDELERNGFRVLQRTEHRLVRRDGDRIELESKVTQEPLAMTLSPAAMPPGTRAELRSFEAVGGGKSVQDLGIAVPIAGQIAIEAELGAVIFVDEDSTDMAMHMIVETSVSRNDP